MPDRGWKMSFHKTGDFRSLRENSDFSMIFPFSSHVYKIFVALNLQFQLLTWLRPEFSRNGIFPAIFIHFHVFLHFSPFFSPFFPPKTLSCHRAARLPRLHRLLRSRRGAERCGGDGLPGTTDGGDGGGKISGADQYLLLPFLGE